MRHYPSGHDCDMHTAFLSQKLVHACPVDGGDVRYVGAVLLWTSAPFVFVEAVDKDLVRSVVWWKVVGDMAIVDRVFGPVMVPDHVYIHAVEKGLTFHIGPHWGSVPAGGCRRMAGSELVTIVTTCEVVVKLRDFIGLDL